MLNSNDPLFYSDLDIVLPCYNPPSGWEKRLVQADLYLEKFFSAQGLRYRFIIVNDGSPKLKLKNSEPLLPPHTICVNLVKNQGKGNALRVGFSHSQAPFVLFTDIDLPYELQNILSIYDRLLSTDKPDLVVGERSSDYYFKVPVFRKILSKTFRGLLRFMLKIPVTDSQCGIKGFNTRGKTLLLNTFTRRYLIDLETLALAYQSGLKIRTEPVQLRDGVLFSSMSFKILISELWSLLLILVLTPLRSNKIMKLINEPYQSKGL